MNRTETSASTRLPCLLQLALTDSCENVTVSPRQAEAGLSNKICSLVVVLGGVTKCVNIFDMNLVTLYWLTVFNSKSLNLALKIKEVIGIM